MEGVRVFHWVSAMAGIVVVILISYNQRLVVYPNSDLVIASGFAEQNSSVVRTIANTTRKPPIFSNNQLNYSKTKTRVAPTTEMNSTSKHRSKPSITMKKTIDKIDDKCKKRLPTAIVIGIQKSGTSALCTFLMDHPQIVCAKGEPQYFTSKYKRGPDWYRNCMPCSTSGQITMEKSPPYFYRNYVPLRIKALNPEMKLIVIVKDPIVRAQSMFAMQHRDGKGDFEREVTNARGDININSINIVFSSYAMHMKAWLQTFPLKQFVFINGHNLEVHPEEELKKVETFLQLSPYFEPEKFWFNEDKGKPCVVKENSNGCLGDNKGREHPTMSNKLREKMETYFRPLNKKFFEMIHKRFDWGY